ncbi:MAG: GxxExxY protein [Candidatus Omnitrophica bacterium]|nr:GxxExxY protein [Candidatus Omnitrophota bacterium]
MELLYKEFTEKIIKILFEVFNNLGPGLTEIIYKRAVIEELTSAKLKFSREKNVPVFYKKKRLGIYRLDLIVEDKIILELKVKAKIEPIDEAQIITYLKATGYRIGILVNFGAKKLEFKRFIV